MIEFTEYWVDESHRWDAMRVMPHDVYKLGVIEYHYGFGQWSFWPADVILPQDQMQTILDFLNKPNPTKKERDLYWSYKGDPLAR